MNKMLLTFGLSLCLSASLWAQSTSGLLDSYEFSEKENSLKVKLFAGGDTPEVGQVVEVKKEFTQKMFGADVKGTHGLARGTVRRISTQTLEIEVTEWTGTLEENGVRRPMAKPGATMIVEWIKE